jgi:uncharacterized protein (TIGR03435 family)
MRSRAVLIALTCVTLVAQVATQTFDAASIKESADTANTGGGMRLLPSGDIRVQHMTARALITIAHQVEPYQLVGAPDWTNASYFDINARANAATTREQTFAMMRALLAERFKLAVHREMREVQGFALVRASDRLGPGLTPTSINCEENPRGPRCSEGGITSTTFNAFGIPLPNVIRLLAGHMSAPIVDETKLAGTFDVALRWANEPGGSDDAPVIGTAIREQLGLRLERRQVPLEVLVVDRIERPAAD